MNRYTQGTVVTANARLSRQMRRDYDGERRREVLHVWESPDILPRGAWLERVWQECAYREPFDTPVLLSATQEEALWEQSIAGSSEADELLDLPATVSAAEQAWNLGITNYIKSSEEIEEFVFGLAASVSANSPLSVSVMKESLRLLSSASAITPELFERIQGLRRVVYDSEDYQEGIDAFREKRKPVFHGK